jgi:hypothetical protein
VSAALVEVLRGHPEPRHWRRLAEADVRDLHDDGLNIVRTAELALLLGSKEN